MPDEPRDPSSLSKPELFLAVGSKIAGIFSVVGFVVAAAGSNAPSEADFLGYAGASGVGAFLGMWVSAICVIGVAALLGRTEALEASDDSEYTIKHGAEINAIGGCLGALVAIASSATRSRRFAQAHWCMRARRMRLLPAVPPLAHQLIRPGLQPG